MRKLALAVLLTSGLAGCAPFVQFGNEAGVTVGGIDPLNAPQAYRMEDEHCRKYGLVSQYDTKAGQYDFVFRCVRPK